MLSIGMMPGLVPGIFRIFSALNIFNTQHLAQSTVYPAGFDTVGNKYQARTVVAVGPGFQMFGRVDKVLHRIEQHGLIRSFHFQ